MSHAIAPTSADLSTLAQRPSSSGARPHREACRTSVLRDASAVAAVRDDWQALLNRSDASLFNGPAWIEAWLRQFGAGREPFVITARDDAGRLIGLMPLSIGHRRAMGLRIRRLGFLADTEVFGDYMDCVVENGCEATVMTAVLDEIKRRTREWDVLDLRDLSSESPTIAAARQVFDGRSWVVTETDGETCPFVRFESGQPFDVFLKATRRRDNYMRRRKWLQRQPGFVIERVDNPTLIREHMEIFLRLHALRWQGQVGGIRGPELSAFHHDAAHRMAVNGQVQLFTMRVGGQPVASVYGLRDHKRFLYYNAGYDPAWASKSVGMVLIGETFAAAIEQGLQEYDFLRGDEGYKTDWVNHSRRLVSLRVHAARSRGVWLGRHERCASVARRVLRRSVG